MNAYLPQSRGDLRQDVINITSYHIGAQIPYIHRIPYTHHHKRLMI